MLSDLPPRRRIRVLLAALALAFVTPAFAQVPSTEQLEIFRNLSPEQQEALLEQLAQGQGQGQDAAFQPPKEAPPAEAPGRTRPGAQRDALPEEPALRPRDTVLIEARLRETEGVNSDQRNRMTR